MIYLAALTLTALLCGTYFVTLALWNDKQRRDRAARTIIDD